MNKSETWGNLDLSGAPDFNQLRGDMALSEHHRKSLVGGRPYLISASRSNHVHCLFCIVILTVGDRDMTPRQTLRKGPMSFN